MKSYPSIKEIIPTAASFFVLLSVTKAMIFYSIFGIRILDYLTFSESILLFFDDILILVIPLIFTIGYIFIISIYIENKFIFENKYILFIKIIALGLIILYLVYLYKLFSDYFHFTSLFTWGYLYLSLMIAGVPFLAIFHKFREKREQYKENEKFKGLLLLQKDITRKLLAWVVFISIIGGGIQKLYKDLKYTLAEEPESIVKCEFNDGSNMSSNKDTLYIGRTSSNLFFYLPQSKSALIYKTENLKLIKLINVKTSTQKPFDYF